MITKERIQKSSWKNVLYNLRRYPGGYWRITVSQIGIGAPITHYKIMKGGKYWSLWLKTGIGDNYLLVAAKRKTMKECAQLAIANEFYAIAHGEYGHVR